MSLSKRIRKINGCLQRKLIFMKFLTASMVVRLQKTESTEKVGFKGKELKI